LLTHATEVLTDSAIDLKPENLLYQTRSADSQLVLADFGIAKTLETPTEVLTSMAGSFGYAAPEVMLKRGHGKAVDIWSLGVITYTLLCGYSPFRSENLTDLIEECRAGRIIFHERYWKGVSQDAKNFIMTLLQPDPDDRPTSEEALKHPWLKGESASDRDLLPEIRAFIAKARLRRGIEIVKLANRIEALKMHEDEADGDDIPSPAAMAESAGAEEAAPADSNGDGKKKRSLGDVAKGAIFREVVMAKVREMKENEELEKVEREAREKASQ
jgi:calcium/calmodulin-dependent protein kinase I